MKNRVKKGKKNKLDFFKFIKKQYADAFLYLKESRKYIYYIVGVFLFFSLIGFFIPLPEDISNNLLNYFKQLVLQTENYNFKEMSIFLFKNNVNASFLGLFLGIILGVFSIFNAIANGFVLGFVASISVSESGLFSLWRLFPHGIFELPALFISLGLGVRLGTFVLRKEDSFLNLLKNSIRTFVLIVVPLLILAALIESALIVFR